MNGLYLVAICWQRTVCFRFFNSIHKSYEQSRQKSKGIFHLLNFTINVIRWTKGTSVVKMAIVTVSLFIYIIIAKFIFLIYYITPKSF